VSRHNDSFSKYVKLFFFFLQKLPTATLKVKRLLIFNDARNDESDETREFR